MSNAFVHIELSTSDVAKAKQFYQKIFKWTLEDMKMGGQTYTMLKPESGTGGGMQRAMPGSPTIWLPYVEVEDVDETVARAKKLGARILVDRMEVGMGALAVFVDPTGATLGIWETKKAPAPKTTRVKAAKAKVAKPKAAKAKAAKAKPAKAKATKSRRR